jgi:hypothetical protein
MEAGDRRGHDEGGLHDHVQPHRDGAANTWKLIVSYRYGATKAEV